jgi:hypothetical protein
LAFVFEVAEIKRRRSYSHHTENTYPLLLAILQIEIFRAKQQKPSSPSPSFLHLDHLWSPFEPPNLNGSMACCSVSFKNH